MKTKKTTLVTLISAICVLLGSTGYAQREEGSDRTLSPYFFVKSEDSEIDQLPLQSTAVKVNITGVIADVTVTQVYKNEGKRALEAIYVFPGSTRAAVYGMRMTVGERSITAKIRKREDARHDYEQAKRDGKSASLLEQHRPNVFQMNVANILPGDLIRVELNYTELLVPSEAVYEFVYPTVVGPRYSDQRAVQADAQEKWIENPYLHQGESPTYTFNIMVNLAAGLPIQELTCSSHQVNINYEGPALASLRLDPSEKYGGNRDFMMKYRLAGGAIQSGVLLFEGKKENFFLLMLQPPKRVSDAHIPHREYIFIIDVSGSMHGFPLNISKKLLSDLISNLRPSDRFNVLLFAGSSSIMSEQSLPANTQNIRRAVNMIERQRGGGGTRLLPALRRALSLPKTEGFSRTVVIATDGYVSVEKETFDLIRNSLGNANLFAFGIGSSVNRYIIEGMARVGMGEPFIVTSPKEALAKAKRFRNLIQHPVLTGIRVDYGEFEVYDVEPPGIPDVMADRPVIVFGKWHGKPNGNIRLRGISGENPFTREIDLSSVKPREINSALRYLWARHRIAILSDYNSSNPQDEKVLEVTNLGLTYNLLTAHTSFVAIDTQIRLQDGQALTVKQPIPLPHGVSDYAVGNQRAFAQKTSSFGVSSCTAIPSEGKVMELSRKYRMEDRLASEPATHVSHSEKNVVEIGEVFVTEGLSKDKVRNLLKKNIQTIKKCFAGPASKESYSKGEVAFRLVVDASGKVIEISAGRGRRRIRVLEQCLFEKLAELQFPAPEAGRTVKVTIIFILK